MNITLFLIISVLCRFSVALVCYNCTDCSAPGAIISQITCDGLCFIGIDNENRVVQKCFDDPSGYQMYHTCDVRDFCNINVFSQIKIVDNNSSTTLGTAGVKSTPKDTLYYLMTTNQQTNYNNMATQTTTNSSLQTQTITTPSTSSVATKQYYYVDMAAYTTTRNNGCGYGAYTPATTTAAPCRSAASSSAIAINKIYSVLVFVGFYIISF